MKQRIATALAGTTVLLLAACQSAAAVEAIEKPAQAAAAADRVVLLQQAVAHPQRIPAFVTRDSYWHCTSTAERIQPLCLIFHGS